MNLPAGSSARVARADVVILGGRVIKDRYDCCRALTTTYPDGFYRVAYSTGRRMTLVPVEEAAA